MHVPRLLQPSLLVTCYMTSAPSLHPTSANKPKLQTIPGTIDIEIVPFEPPEKIGMYARKNCILVHVWSRILSLQHDGVGIR